MLEDFPIQLRELRFKEFLERCPELEQLYMFTLSVLAFTYSQQAVCTFLMVSFRAALLAICLMSSSGCNTVKFSQSSSILAEDEQTIRDLATEWVKIGLDSKNNSEEQIAEFYDSTSSVVLYNNDNPQRQIENSVEEYSKSWSNFFQNNEISDRKLLEVHQVIVEGDLASSVFSTELTITGGRGKSVNTSLVTLVWRRTSNGWRIIHEHSSAINSSKNTIVENQVTMPLQAGPYRRFNYYFMVYQKGERICVQNVSNRNSASYIASVRPDPNNPSSYQVHQSPDWSISQVDSNTLLFGQYEYTKEEEFPLSISDAVQRCLDSTLDFYEAQQ